MKNSELRIWGPSAKFLPTVTRDGLIKIIQEQIHFELSFLNYLHYNEIPREIDIANFESKHMVASWIRATHNLTEQKLLLDVIVVENCVFSPWAHEESHKKAFATLQFEFTRPQPPILR